MFKLETKDKQGVTGAAFPSLFRLLAADETPTSPRINIACNDQEGYLDLDKIIDKTWSNEIDS